MKQYIAEIITAGLCVVGVLYLYFKHCRPKKMSVKDHMIKKAVKG